MDAGRAGNRRTAGLIQRRMRTHHWLLLAGLFMIVAGFLWLAAVIVKVILWVAAAGLLLGSATSCMTRRR